METHCSHVVNAASNGYNGAQIMLLTAQRVEEIVLLDQLLGTAHTDADTVCCLAVDHHRGLVEWLCRIRTEVHCRITIIAINQYRCLLGRHIRFR